MLRGRPLPGQIPEAEVLMIIDLEACAGCGACEPYCPVGAIAPGGEKTAKGRAKRDIDLEACVECGTCLRIKVCPADAVKQQTLTWPRSVRSAFSNPQTEHKSRDMGRGTEEMKTNEITHRFEAGEVGVAIELGRPLVGAGFRDVERVTMAMARLGVAFEERNPLTSLIEDRATGAMRRDILEEKVLSTIVEFKVKEERLPEVLSALRDVAPSLDTVFSLGLIHKLPSSGPDELPKQVRRLGFEVRPNGKVNLGLGRAILQ